MADARLSDCPAHVTVTCALHNIEKINAIRPSGSLKRSCRLCAAERLRKHRASGRRQPEDPVKRAARKIVERAIREGRLVQSACGECGAQRAHAHHEDYSKPLDVVWLCPKHHKNRHRRGPRQENSPAAT